MYDTVDLKEDFFGYLFPSFFCCCWLNLNLDNLSSYFKNKQHRFGVTTNQPKAALAAESWTAPADWKEQDFESEMKKLEKEAEDRLDGKVAELMSKIETTGQK